MEAEYTGGSVSYYAIKVERPTNPGADPYTAECNDIIEALGMNYAEGNAFKAIWRRCAARLGKSKKGYTDGLYDAEKVVFFGQRLVAQEKAGYAENCADLIGVACGGDTSNLPKWDVTIMTDGEEETPTHASMVIDGIAYTITQALAEKIERMAEAEAAQSDDKGWIDWHGGECPVYANVRVDYELRSGAKGTIAAAELRWSHGDRVALPEYDIIKYRIHKEQ